MLWFSERNSWFKRVTAAELGNVDSLLSGSRKYSSLIWYYLLKGDICNAVDSTWPAADKAYILSLQAPGSAVAPPRGILFQFEFLEIQFFAVQGQNVSWQEAKTSLFPFIYSICRIFSVILRRRSLFFTHKLHQTEDDRRETESVWLYFYCLLPSAVF